MGSHFCIRNRQCETSDLADLWPEIVTKYGSDILVFHLTTEVPHHRRIFRDLGHRFLWRLFTFGEHADGSVHAFGVPLHPSAAFRSEVADHLRTLEGMESVWNHDFRPSETVSPPSFSPTVLLERVRPGNLLAYQLRDSVYFECNAGFRQWAYHVRWQRAGKPRKAPPRKPVRRPIVRYQGGYNCVVDEGGYGRIARYRNRKRARQVAYAFALMTSGDVAHEWFPELTPMKGLPQVTPEGLPAAIAWLRLRFPSDVPKARGFRGYRGVYDNGRRMECGPEQVCGFKNAKGAARAYDKSKVLQYELIEAFPYLNFPDEWQDHRKRLLTQLWLAASTVLSAAWAPPAYPEGDRANDGDGVRQVGDTGHERCEYRTCPALVRETPQLTE